MLIIIVNILFVAYLKLAIRVVLLLIKLFGTIPRTIKEIDEFIIIEKINTKIIDFGISFIGFYHY